MQSNSAHMMAMANSFWPFAYSFGKSYDLSLHPAFLSSACRTLPALPLSPYTQTNGQTSVPSQPSKSDKFSIDAILNRDKRPDSTGSSVADDTKKFSTAFLENEKLHETSVARRHQRLLEASHPYLGHSVSYTDPHQSHTQTNVSSVYRQLSESPRTGGK